MMTKELGALDLSKDAQELSCLIRGVNPWPGAYITLPDGQPLKIWAAKPLAGITEGQPGDFIKADSKDGLIIRTGNDTALEVTLMQMPGGKRMAPKDYLRGHKI